MNNSCTHSMSWSYLIKSVNASVHRSFRAANQAAVWWGFVYEPVCCSAHFDGSISLNLNWKPVLKTRDPVGLLGKKDTCTICSKLTIYLKEGQKWGTITTLLLLLLLSTIPDKWVVFTIITLKSLQCTSAEGESLWLCYNAWLSKWLYKNVLVPPSNHHHIISQTISKPFWHRATVV